MKKNYKTYIMELPLDIHKKLKDAAFNDNESTSLKDFLLRSADERIKRLYDKNTK